jgi:hypothetical protein
MDKVTLVFPSIQALWKFRREINAPVFDINVAARTLICKCSKEDIDLATIKYKAKVAGTSSGKEGD